MPRLQHIVFGETGQFLTWDAPEGRPSAVTDVQVFAMGIGDSGTEEAAVAAGAVETNPNTTVDAASGLGQTDPRKVNLTATTGVEKGRSYLVTDDDTGVSEWIEALEVVSGSHVIARDPLANAYSVGATFVGTRITAAVDATWVADSGNISDDQDVIPGYRVRWTYTVAGVKRTHHSDFDLVRYPGAHTVLPAAAEAMYPGYRQRLPSLHQTDEGRRLIDEAYQQVRWDLTDANLDGARVRSQDAIDRATLLRFGVILARANVLAGRTDRAALDDALAEYGAFMGKVFRSAPKVASSVDSSGSGVRTGGAGIWER